MKSPIIMQYLLLLKIGAQSVLGRRWVVLMNAVGTVVTVIMLLSFLAIKAGFDRTLAATGDEKVAIVLREGAQAEISSVLTIGEADVLKGYPGIKTLGAEVLMSPESYVMVDIEGPPGQGHSSIPFRGLTASGVSLRSGFNLIEGRMNDEGKNEILVGQSLAKKIPYLNVGAMIYFGKAKWLVAGIFNFDGKQSVFEGEMWTDTRIIQSHFNREETIQSVRAALKDEADVDGFRDWSRGDKRLSVQIKSEKEFYQELADKTNNLIFYIGWPLSIVMAIGALAGSLNLMHTMVQNRAKEIAVLRSVGFRKASIVSAVVSESVAIAMIASLAGCILGYLLFDGVKASIQGSGHTQVIYSYQIGISSCLQAVALALAVGLLGGLGPAFKATKGSVRDAFNIL